MNQLPTLKEFCDYKSQYQNQYLSEDNIDYIEKHHIGLPKHKEYHTIQIKYDQSNQATQKIIETGHLIGVFWLEKNENTLKIRPRQINDKYVDFYAMLDEVLQHPKVNKHLDDCYKIYDNQPKVSVDKEFSDLANLFLLLHFLRLVKTISRQGLKKGYIKKTENLNAKIKGKILVNETIRHNHFKGRQDKTYCQYQEFSTNCIENQIIATTLDNISPFVYQSGNKALINLLNQNKATFRNIDRIKLSPRTFTRMKISNFFRNYKKTIELARQIYHNHVPALSAHKSEFDIFPFYINMPELFERYCEVKLRKQYNDVLAGYASEGYSETKTKHWELRPDFLIPSLNMIVDSKYKPWYAKNSTAEAFKSDFQQLSLYGRHEDILEQLNLDGNQIPSLLFIYPHDNTQENSIENLDFDINKRKKEEHFCEIYKLPIQIPLRKSLY